MIGWAPMTSEWRHFCHIRPKKKGFAGGAVRPTALEIQKNVSDIKDVKSKGLQNCYLGFLKFLDFNPQKIRKIFFNITAKKSNFLISKKRNKCDSPYRLLFTYRIWDRYLFFGQVMAKKKLQNWWQSNFQTQFSAILDVVAQNKDHHWTPRDKLNRINTHFMQNYQLWNLTFFYLTLTWPSTESDLNRTWWSYNRHHWVGNEKLAIKHASHSPRKVGFICWPLVTWPGIISDL